MDQQHTLLARKQFVERLFRVDEMRDLAGGMPQDPMMKSAQGAGRLDNRPENGSQSQFPPQVMAGEANRDAMRAKDFGQVKGAGRMGQEGRERFMRAAATIQFDSGKYLAQFSGQPYGVVKRAVLPGEPANPLNPDMSQQQMLKALLLDPMYQLK